MFCKKKLLVSGSEVCYHGSIDQWEMYVCHTNQIGATINNQSNCCWLRWIICEELPSWFENSHLCFSTNRNRYSSDISDASFTMVEPRTLWISFKGVQNSIISRRIIVFGIHSHVIKALCQWPMAYKQERETAHTMGHN